MTSECANQSIVSSAVQPYAAAVAWASASIRVEMMSCVARLKQRMVPSSAISDGMTLADCAEPPWIAPTLTTAVSSGGTLRLTTVCSAMTYCAWATVTSVER